MGRIDRHASSLPYGMGMGTRMREKRRIRGRECAYKP
jgi:hypothetical protein